MRILSPIIQLLYASFSLRRAASSARSVVIICPKMWYDKDKLDESIVYALNNRERFRKSFPGFMASALSLEPGAQE